jgi:hypothetical protein
MIRHDARFFNVRAAFRDKLCVVVLFAFGLFGDNHIRIIASKFNKLSS